MNPSPSPDHRRKKKHHRHKRTLLRQSLLSCLSILALLFLLISHTSSSFHFHPVSTLSLLQDFTGPPPLIIENRVLFPDHVLLLVTGDVNSDLECVYFTKNQSTTKNLPAFSVDKHDRFRFKSIVRCPIPTSDDHSSPVNLKWINGGKSLIFGNNNNVTYSWDSVAYEAVIDGSNVAVFVKGLNLRPNRFTNPRHFTCHFGDGTLQTEALTAAQEIVRCPLPPGKIGARVTVGFKRNYHARSRNPILIPSVAKVLDETPRRNEKHKLCVCTMVRNQASSIREWITYHAWLGVGRWFIYDNNSEDGVEKIIDQLNLENHNITRHVWPWIKTQEAGFSHCALRARNECEWVSFIDVDEYFYFPNSPYQAWTPGPNSLRALVSNVSRNNNVGEIRTHCRSYGPSGLTSPPPQGVTVGYTCRMERIERHKSIVRPESLDPGLINVVHHFQLKDGFESLNLPADSVVINHYKYQVWEVFREKFHRRVATYVVDWRENQNEGSRDRAPGLGTEAIEPSDWPRRFCEVWDTGLRDFVLSNLVDLSTGLLLWEGK